MNAVVRTTLGLAAFAFTATAAVATVPGLEQAAGGYPVGTAADVGALKLAVESDPSAAVSGAQVFVAAGLSREREVQNGVAALVAESVLRTRVDGMPLAVAVAARGGSITYAIDARTARYYLEARSADLPAVVELFGRALAAPDFSPVTVDAGRVTLNARIARDDANALDSGIQMFRRAYFTDGSRLPADGSAASLAALDPAAVRAFHAANYVRSALTASVVGAAVPALSTALGGVATGLPDRPAEAAVPMSSPKPLPVEAPRIISRRDVGAPWIVVGFGAPSPDSADFGPMLVLQALLSESFERHSTTSLGFVERSVGTEYLYDTRPATMVLYVNGTLVDPSVAIRELLAVSSSLGKRPLTASELAAFKTAATGRFVLDSTTLADRSYRLGAFASGGLGPNGLNVVLDEIRNTTAADVKRTAAAYLGRYIVALVLPRETPAAAATPAPIRLMPIPGPRSTANPSSH